MAKPPPAYPVPAVRPVPTSPIVRHDIAVRGFVYEVETGRLREVE